MKDLRRGFCVGEVRGLVRKEGFDDVRGWVEVRAELFALPKVFTT